MEIEQASQWPDFFLAGDLKAGSTSLYFYLRDHKDLYFPKGRKELRYFSTVGEEYTAVQYSGSKDYLDLFSAKPPDILGGDASPEYLRSPFVAERIYQKNPKAKFIFVLRNPAHRLFSAHQMKVRRNGKKIDFSQDIRSSNYGLVKQSYVFYDLYKFYKLFGDEQILSLDFDDLVKQPRKVLTSVYNFLGVSHEHFPDFDVHNLGGLPKNPGLYSFLNKIRKLRGHSNVPSWARVLWRKFRARNIEKPKIKSFEKDLILQICREDTLRVRELTGLELRGWDSED